MYPIQKASRTEFVPIRHLNYHVRQWGTPSPERTPLVMVHGWMDVSASFQFVIDALQHDHWVIAPDWRGFGLTETPGIDNYWFPDYLADLDQLLDHYVGDRPVNLVGHSMGGHIATMYSGIRPERIARLVNLEGFGMPASRASQAPGRYAKWMDELKAVQRGEMDLKPYASLEGVAQRLMKTNPQLGSDKAHWLAQHWSQANAQGEWRILGHAAHKVINAQLFKVDETQAIYERITAPTLCVVAGTDSLTQWWKDKYTLTEFMARIASVPQLQHAVIQDAGHMLHHDQPEELAQLLETFLA
ncbi:alpha/beta hydrolase [Limnohabitans sp. TS-CS-82]|uniref:alpha/beta fold hydrolase n=1 Tax=Limnohabitans sp. TS-CS-82 TaxID=2094193 RepID=UPI000CF1EB39|nr:alpha/beta hydrolase [Limnohabitans sp. TS-CS-82]PQA80871.1 alpha/beta hydrolase [Limnohabitans sp. TS-CS-82]